MNTNVQDLINDILTNPKAFGDVLMNPKYQATQYQDAINILKKPQYENVINTLKKSQAELTNILKNPKYMAVIELYINPDYKPIIDMLNTNTITEILTKGLSFLFEPEPKIQVHRCAQTFIYPYGKIEKPTPC